MPGWIETRPNGRYRARFRTPAGGTVSETFDLMRDANEWLDDQRGTAVRGTWIDPRKARQAFSAWADEWAAAQDAWKQSTRDEWPTIRKRLVARIGTVPIGAVDLMVLRRLRADLAEAYAPLTVRLTMAYAGMIMRAAHASRRIGYDPTAGLRGKRARADERAGQAVGPDDVPTRAEALAIIAAAPLRFRAGVALGFAGLRVSEVLGLTADRVDLPSRRVTIDRQARRGRDGAPGWTTPKAEKVRTITVPGLVAVELRRHMRNRPGGVLFTGARGAAMLDRDGWYRAAWRPALRTAGLVEEVELDDGSTELVYPFRFHSSRHWCASTLLAEGAPITAVAGHLGDTVETVSRTYAHWLRDDRDVPAGVLDRVLAGDAAPTALPSGS